MLRTSLDITSVLAKASVHPGPTAPTGDVASPGAPRSTVLTTVPLRLTGGLVGARWDDANRRVLVVTPSRAGGQDELAWWFVQW